MLEQGKAQPGGGLKKTGIGLIILGGLLYAILGGPDDNPAGFLGIPVMLTGMLLYFRGRQHSAKAIAADPQGPIYDSQAHVLYLRAFQTDAGTAVKKLMTGFTTEEEQLADVLRPFGDMIAIGRPDESLPMPGAVRIYATDSSWKSVVLDRMQRAPLVVVRAGAGTGLLWEFTQVFTTLPPSKVLILVMNMTKREYSAFADHVRDTFKIKLPTIGSFGMLRAAVDVRENSSKVLPGFISFSDDWNPTFLRLPSTIVRLGYNDTRKSFNIALRPVFDQHGIPWQTVGRL